MNNKIICERFVYTYHNEILSRINECNWYDIITHKLINVTNLINNEGYVIVDVKTSNSAACSQQAGTQIFVDHTIITLQKIEQ